MTVKFFVVQDRSKYPLLLQTCESMPEAAKVRDAFRAGGEPKACIRVGSIGPDGVHRYL